MREGEGCPRVSPSHHTHVLAGLPLAHRTHCIPSLVASDAQQHIAGGRHTRSGPLLSDDSRTLLHAGSMHPLECGALGPHCLHPSSHTDTLAADQSAL